MVVRMYGDDILGAMFGTMVTVGLIGLAVSGVNCGGNCVLP